MCGRYTLTTPLDGMRALFGFDAMVNLAPRHNISPGQDVFVVRGTERELVALRWGLIPSWAKDPAIGNRMVNARAESGAEKPSFRSAFKRRRCLIPADGFYEWQGAKGGPKQPFHIRLEGGALFAFAGLWEHWLDGAGNEIETCAIVTTEATEALATIHHRMPVILDPAGFDTWLGGEAHDAGALMQPYPGGFETWPVSTRVNKVVNDDASLLEPVTIDPSVESAAPRQLDLL